MLSLFLIIFIVTQAVMRVFYMILGSVHIFIANKVLNVCIFICAYQIICFLIVITKH